MVKELGLEIKYDDKEPYKEDISERIKYIESLPKRDIRGFSLHADRDWYYLVWGDSGYYIGRAFNNDSGAKYTCPAGHSRPPYIVTSGRPNQTTVYVVEGEFNALSLSLALPGTEIVSYGSASNLINAAPLCRNFKEVIIIADKDKAGAIGAIELKAKLMETHRVQIILMEEDANDIYVKKGKEELRDTILRQLF